MFLSSGREWVFCNTNPAVIDFKEHRNGYTRSHNDGSAFGAECSIGFEPGIRPIEIVDNKESTLPSVASVCTGFALWPLAPFG